MPHWTDRLVAMHACPPAVEWALTQPDLATAWANCQRGEWMLWLCGKMYGPSWSEGRRKLVRAAADCAELALPYIRDKETAGIVLSVLQTCVAWSEGEASDEEMRAAAAASSAAYAAYAASAAAYAASAAYAAAATVYAADAAAVRTRILSECADIVRGHYPEPPEMEGKP